MLSTVGPTPSATTGAHPVGAAATGGYTVGSSSSGAYDLAQKIAQYYTVWRFNNSKALPGEQVEFEVRLGIVPTPKGTIGGGTNPLFWKNAYARALGMNPTTKLKSQYIVQSFELNGIVYRTHYKPGQENVWQSKKTLMSEDVSDRWLKLAIASEAMTRRPNVVNPLMTIRQISRHSFIVGCARIDLSKVLMAGKIYYEVEVEFYPYERALKALHRRRADEVRRHERQLVEDALAVGKVYQPPPILVVPSSIEAKYAAEETRLLQRIMETELDPTPMVQAFVSTVQELLQAMFQSPLPFTFQELGRVGNSVNSKILNEPNSSRYIDRLLMSEPANLDVKMINHRYFFGSYKRPYSWNISLKIDGGERGGHRWLVVCDLGTWLIQPPHQEALYALSVRHVGIEMTILDGELADRYQQTTEGIVPVVNPVTKLPEQAFWVADAVMINGKSLGKDEPVHRRRYQAAYEWVQEQATAGYEDILPANLPIFFKAQFEVNDGDDFFIKLNQARKLMQGGDLSQVRRFYPTTSQGTAKEIYEERVSNDGLIFTPNDMSYFSASPWGRANTGGMTGEPATETFSRERTLHKWKENYTIDLRYDKASDGTFRLYAATEEKGVEVPFTGSRKNPFKGRVSLQPRGAKEPIIADKGSIIEFECVKGDLVAFRPRDEKKGPNRIRVAEDDWDKMLNPSEQVSFEDLTGQTNVLMRKYHNRLVGKLFYQAAQAVKPINNQPKILLDIGSGRGGGLNKMGEYDIIILVEPSLQFAATLKERLAGMPAKLQSRVHLLEGIRGQDGQTIQDFLYHHTQGRKADVVSMIDSLTFFFDESGESLKQLAQTLEMCLKPRGLFIWKAMDANAVRARVEEMQSSNPSLDRSQPVTLEFGQDSITYTAPNSFHTIIKPHIDAEEYGFDEPLMRLTLKLTGIANVASEEPLIPSPYRELSRLYHFGTYIYHNAGSINLPAKQLLTVFGDYTPQEAAFKPSIIEAVESLFTRASHLSLMEQYWTLALTDDVEPESEICQTGAGPFTRFETVHQGYFLNKLAQSEWKKSEKEILFRNPDGPEDKTQMAMAFTALLGFDLYLVDHEGYFHATSASEQSTRPALLVQHLSDKEYVALSIDELFIHYQPELTTRKGQAVTYQPLRSMTEIYQACRFVRLLGSYVSFTRVTEHLAFDPNIDIDLRLACMANWIADQGREVNADDLAILGYEAGDDEVLNVLKGALRFVESKR